MATARKEKEAGDAGDEIKTRHRKVGPYRILGPLGKGGMAQVFRGLHEALQREVAIKELLPEGAANKDTLSRFRREALALASMRHQNVVAVYDLVDKAGAQFLILELVDGPTLHELLKDAPLPPMVAAVVGAQLCAALEHAHFHRIIHRDLKPANVMLGRVGEVKLMDFGIARDEDLGRLTQTGMAIGTPAYMSPEQVTGSPLDHRTDLYSLGVLLYECVSGKRAFSGGSPGEVFARVREGKFPPLHKQATHAPHGLVKIIKKAMRSRPDDRYFDAAAMRRDLESFLGKNLRVSQQAVLLAFLRGRGRVSETEVLAHLTQGELDAAGAFDTPEPSISIELDFTVPRRSGTRWLLVLALLVGAGAAAYHHAAWLPMARALLQP